MLSKGESSKSCFLATEASDVLFLHMAPPLSASGSGNTYSSVWVGIDGYQSNSVEQIGTEQDIINGQPVYSAWYEMYPKWSVNLPMTIHAGDSISASVTYVSSFGNKQTFTLTL